MAMLILDPKRVHAHRAFRLTARNKPDFRRLCGRVSGQSGEIKFEKWWLRITTGGEMSTKAQRFALAATWPAPPADDVDLDEIQQVMWTDPEPEQPAPRVSRVTREIASSPAVRLDRAVHAASCTFVQDKGEPTTFRDAVLAHTPPALCQPARRCWRETYTAAQVLQAAFAALRGEA